MPIHLSSAQPDFAERFSALLSMKREDAADVNDAVAAIIADVRDRGDAALVELTKRFDRLALTPETLAFSKAEVAAEIAKVSLIDTAEAAAVRNAVSRLPPMAAETRPVSGSNRKTVDWWLISPCFWLFGQ